MATTRRSFLAMTVGGLASVATGPALHARSAAAQAPVPFKIGCVVQGEFAGTGVATIALEKGFFRQNGIAAEIIPFKGGPDLLKGVLAGNAEMALSGATDTLVFRERGTPIRDIAVTTEKNHFTFIVTPKIATLAEVKGGTIGVTAVGSSTWIFARLVAKKMAWDPERDVRIVGVGGFDSMVAGLRRGELQAVIFGDAGAVVEETGAGKILMRLDEVTPRWISNMAYSTEEIIKTKKDTLHRVLRGLFQGIKFARENKAESVKIAAKGIGWSEAATGRAYDLVRPLLPRDGRIDVEALKIMQDTLLELGVLKKRLPLEDHYTTEFTPVHV